MTNAAISSKSLESAKPLTRSRVTPLESVDGGTPAGTNASFDASTDGPLRPSQPVPKGSRGTDWSQPRVTAILEAAARCFSRRGFGATTLAEIGQELGLRKSIVHYYFSGKTALVHEVQRFVMHRFLAKVREALATNGTPAERARSALRALYEVARDDETARGLSIEVWSARRRDRGLHEQAAQLDDERRALVSSTLGSLLEIDTDGARLDTIGALVLATLDGLAVSNRESPEGAARSERAFELLLRLMEPELSALRSTADRAG